MTSGRFIRIQLFIKTNNKIFLNKVLFNDAIKDINSDENFKMIINLIWY